MNAKRRELRFAALVLGLLFINWPILEVVNKKTFVSGIPVLYVYIVVFWLFMIGISYFLNHKKG